jgi:hypothetical protein
MVLNAAVEKDSTHYKQSSRRQLNPSGPFLDRLSINTA